jgi:hypothetical protein
MFLWNVTLRALAVAYARVNLGRDLVTRAWGNFFSAFRSLLVLSKNYLN